MFSFAVSFCGDDGPSASRGIAGAATIYVSWKTMNPG
jgi:hypothetical protein